MKIMTIVGARPQFIKAAGFANTLKNHLEIPIQHTLVHTGQHHDEMMSNVFFRELEIGEPNFNLAIAGGNHGEMTGKMLERIEGLLINQNPDWILIYGDTNSTIASALAAAKLHIKIAHVEAGLRSFNMDMPEEINRIVTDRLSTLLFCPTELAVQNLHKEGITQGVHLVGDIMYDVALHFSQIADRKSNILKTLDICNVPFVLATCHRAENTDNPEKLASILRALNTISKEKNVVLPLHPRTRKKIEQFGLSSLLKKLTTINPLSYLDMIMLQKSSDVIITDSGGVQKEAFFYKIPCITTRDETEWVETIKNGWNVLTGANEQRIVNEFHNIGFRKPIDCKPYGDGHAAEYILANMLSKK